jgi:PAS domain S-box-containing protein
LLIEDSESDAKLVLRELRRIQRPIDSVRVCDAASVRDALVDRETDVVLSDWSMPCLRALDALAIVREHDSNVPFIIVSGTIGEETAVDAIRAGANDYVLKDKLSRLVPSVERELRDAASRTAHQRAQEALRASEARYARLSESGIIGIAVADLAGGFHEANEAFLSLVGYTHDELISGDVKWEALTPERWYDPEERALSQLRADGVAPPWEKELLRKDGSCVPVLMGVAMLQGSRCIAFTADLSERKRAEEALRQTEDQLRQSQKMEAIGTLAGGVAHDFNNILTVILSYSALLAASLASGDPMKDDLDQIYAAGESAAMLTRQLLAFSRKQILRPKVVRLDATVSTTEPMLRRVIGEDVELIVHSDPELGYTKIDPGQIQQVLMNLVVNARDAMPYGGRVTIETMNVVLDQAFVADHVGASHGPHVMLCVSDTGVGMDAKTCARIFEPFFSTKAERGTGLGLSTVFGIVQQSGGTIWVDSGVGKGTTFRLYFPRSDATKVVEEALEEDAVSLRGNETILLVEDDDRVRLVARTVLRQQGYDVLEARTPGDALLVAEQHPSPIDLLLTDVVMPRMNGQELADRVVEARPTLRILFMSGYADDAILRRGIDAGIAFIQKPITPGVLTRTVRRVLDGVGITDRASVRAPGPGAPGSA